MTDPYFSVIIPTLNEEKYLPKLIDALSEQTYKDFEAILVDGQSDDKTVEVFKKLGGKLPAVQVLVSEKRNVAFQRNWGAKNSKAKYLIFFDADVNVNKTFLEEIHLAAIKRNFSLATTWIKPDSKKEIDQVMFVLSNLGLEIAKIINKPFTGGYNTIIERKVFLKLKGYREDLVMSEDHDLAIRAYKKGIETVILPEPKVTFSLRRYRAEGTLTVLRKYAKASIYMLLKGPITHKLFEYEMGGQAHRRKKKKINWVKVDTYFNAIERLEDKVNSLLN